MLQETTEFNRNILVQPNEEIAPLDLSNSAELLDQQLPFNSLAEYIKSYQKQYRLATEEVKANHYFNQQLVNQMQMLLSDKSQLSSPFDILQANPESQYLLNLHDKLEKLLAIGWHKTDLSSQNFKIIYQLYFHNLDTQTWSEEERWVLAAIAAARDIPYLEMVCLDEVQRAVVLTLFHQGKESSLPLIESFSANTYLQQIRQQVFIPLAAKIATLQLKAAAGDSKASKKAKHLKQLKQELEQQVVVQLAKASHLELEARKIDLADSIQAHQNQTEESLNDALDNLQKSRLKAKKARESRFENGLKETLVTCLNGFCQKAEVQADLAEVRNYLIYYGKYLTGVLLAIPLAGLPLLSKNYSQTFFSTQSKKLVVDLQERVEDIPVSHQTAPPKC